MNKKCSKVYKVMTKEDKQKASKTKHHPTINEIKIWFRILNKELFNGELTYPTKGIQIKYHRGRWGECEAEDSSKVKRRKPDWSIITLNWFFHSKKHFIEILAHEMVHLHQFQKYGEDEMSHGKTFVCWKNKFAKFKVPLSI